MMKMKVFEWVIERSVWFGVLFLLVMFVVVIYEDRLSEGSFRLWNECGGVF